MLNFLDSTAKDEGMKAPSSVVDDEFLSALSTILV